MAEFLKVAAEWRYLLPSSSTTAPCESILATFGIWFLHAGWRRVFSFEPRARRWFLAAKVRCSGRRVV